MYPQEPTAINNSLLYGDQSHLANFPRPQSTSQPPPLFHMSSFPLMSFTDGPMAPLDDFGINLWGNLNPGNSSSWYGAPNNYTKQNTGPCSSDVSNLLCNSRSSFDSSQTSNHH